MMSTKEKVSLISDSKADRSFFSRGELASPFFQPKLTVGPVDDMYEREADHVADQVMRMSEGEVLQRSISPVTMQRKCAACEEEGRVQAKPEGTHEASASISSGIPAGGSAMDMGTRSFMESRFGYDFGGVRIHTGTEAERSAQSVNALAYTSGSRIVFNKGQYTPETENGKRLLAHELTHVVQQGGNDSGYLQRMAPCPGHLNDGAPTPPGWKDYFGPNWMFHCGFRTILEDRSPTPSDPMNECVYDHSGNLVDEHHPYSGCRGTPDQYDSRSSPLAHAIIDSGGIVRSGAGAAAESALHAVASPFEDAYNWLDRGIRGIYGVP